MLPSSTHFSKCGNVEDRPPKIDSCSSTKDRSLLPLSSKFTSAKSSKYAFSDTVALQPASWQNQILTAHHAQHLLVRQQDEPWRGRQLFHCMDPIAKSFIILHFPIPSTFSHMLTQREIGVV